MRYWMLTVVLLAFWLGRETGAGDKDPPKVTTFDEIRCNRIVVGSKLLKSTIDPGAFACNTGVLHTVIGSGTVKVESPGYRATMAAEGDGASVTAKATTSSFQAVLIAKDKGAAMVLTSVTKTGTKLSSLRASGVGSSIWRGGGRFQISDKNGQKRVVLGSTGPTDRTTGTPKFPESTFTLYDAKGNVLERLPRKSAEK